MKLIILACIIGACAAAVLPGTVSPQSYNQDTRARAALDRSAAILKSNSEVNEQGFSYEFETENGISVDASGIESNGTVVVGRYSYTGDDGQVYSVGYAADANGFQPEGAHIPTQTPRFVPVFPEI